MKFLFNNKFEAAEYQNNTIQAILELKFFIMYLEFHNFFHQDKLFRILVFIYLK